MAKRRKVSAPSQEDLSRMEDEFRRETAERAGGVGPLSPAASPAAPIAQVAKEAAGAGHVLPAEMRQAQARDQKDAKRLREAEGQGLVMVDLPTGAIDEAVMVRDRMSLTQSELDELKKSILRAGLRLPVEVFDKGADAGAKRYGLISGYRRLKAVRELHAELDLEKHQTIRAVIRDPEDLGGAIVAMVEENEIRAQLTHFERGRIAVVAAEQGSFGSVEEAVNTLFASASKAKRSKIRSFALIYEELGDMLTDGEMLKEKDGLRLAQVLRQGGEARLRSALEMNPGGDDWGLLEPVVVALEAGEAAPKAKGGRPRQGGRPRTGWVSANKMVLPNGTTLEYGHDGRSYVMRLSGRGVDEAAMETAMLEVARLFGPPD